MQASTVSWFPGFLLPQTGKSSSCLLSLLEEHLSTLSGKLQGPNSLGEQVYEAR